MPIKLKCPECGSPELLVYEQTIKETTWEYYQDSHQFESPLEKKATKQKGCETLWLWCENCGSALGLSDFPELEDYPEDDEMKGRSVKSLNEFLLGN